jgi:hypothetical protein
LERRGRQLPHVMLDGWWQRRWLLQALEVTFFRVVQTVRHRWRWGPKKPTPTLGFFLRTIAVNRAALSWVLQWFEERCPCWGLAFVICCFFSFSVTYSKENPRARISLRKYW